MSDPEFGNMCSGWETYPIRGNSHAATGEDGDSCHRRLVEDSARLFVSQGENFEVMRVLVDCEGKIYFSVNYDPILKSYRH